MSKLCSEPQIQKILQNYVNYLRDDEMKKGYPRFEDYSIFARKLPFYVYDNPAFSAKFDTAFTDFRAVYINKDFLYGLMKCDAIAKALGLPGHHVIFILLHEVAHCLNDDDSRLGLLPSTIANVAQDIANNLILKFGFKEQLHVYPSIIQKVFGHSLYGLTKRELKEYGKLSSETIALDMYRAIVEKMKNNPKPQQANDPNSNQPLESEEQQPSIDPFNIDDIDLETILYEDESSNPVDDFIASFDPDAQPQEQHTATPQEVAEMANAAGLPQSTIDALGMNPPRSRAEIEAIEEMNRISAQQAGQEMQGLWDKMDPVTRGETVAGSAPGYYEEKVQLDGVGKITWRAAVQEMTNESGMGDAVYMMDEIIDEFYADPMLYDGSYVPMEKERGVLLSLIDTSGSMKKPFIMDGMNESVASVDNDGMGSGVSECLVFPADVDVKGKYWTLNEQNKEQIYNELKIIGGGGTDFTNPIKNALLQAKEDEKDVTAILMITDLGASVPNFEMIEEAYEKKLPPIIFVTDNRDSSYRKRFEDSCEGNAVVYYYEEGLVADIAEIQEQMDLLQSSKTSSENQVFSVTTMGM